MGSEIKLKGVKTHNLKGLDVSFPLDSLTVVTGVSGSGKSSLVFDTLYGESYGRYVESLSSFARQYLQAIPRPDLDEVQNLPASIAIHQNRGTRNPRSTVGTLSEVTDLLRVIFGHAGETVCRNGHGIIVEDRPDSIFLELLSRYNRNKIMIVAPLIGFSRMKPSDLKAQLQIQGFSRVFLNGEVKRISDFPSSLISKSSVVVDRCMVDVDDKSRLIGSIELAFKVGRGALRVIFANAEEKDFYGDLICRVCGEQGTRPDPIIFDHNHPLGACKNCQGFGRVPRLDIDQLIPDKSLSLVQEGVRCWRFGSHSRYLKSAIKSAEHVGIDIEKALGEYTSEEMAWLFNGKSGTGFTGIEGYFKYLDRKKYKTHYRIHAARFREYVECDICFGSRLCQESLTVLWKSINFVEAQGLPLDELLSLLKSDMPSSDAQASQRAGFGLLEAFEETVNRLEYLCEMGLSYLSLNRSSMTLSSGEISRIQMARCLGNGLTGTLFCLDEPSSGLHPRDSQNLLNIIDKIKKKGNTIVMVEHESALIGGADHVIELGPEAGSRGGEIVYAGPPKPRVDSERSVYPVSLNKNPYLFIKKANIHNLKNLSVKIPLGALTCVCGVSGSGKSSLVRHTLYPQLQKAILRQREGSKEPSHDLIGPDNVIAGISKVLLISQEGLQRSSRSNIGTYLGLFSEIRKLFSRQPKAQGMGLKPGHFSFNVQGGRCESCKGMGTVVEDLSFLGEISVTCRECDGRRFSDDVLSIKYKNRSFLDILELTITDAREIFFDQPSLVKVLDDIIDLGLGYLTLGQSTSSFSGGEAQRLKLLGIMKDIKKDGPYFLVIDEPTTGLSDSDVEVLLCQMQKLCRKGHTVVVVEHHLGIIRRSDWLIEIGPEAGNLGGNLVYMGVPSGIIGSPDSATAPFIDR